MWGAMVKTPGSRACQGRKPVMITSPKSVSTAAGLALAASLPLCAAACTGRTANRHPRSAYPKHRA